MAPRSSARRSYRKRVRSSHCRQKGPAACRGTKGCKYSSGKKRSFCRKTKNTKRRVGVRTRAMRKQKGGMLGKLMGMFKASAPAAPAGGNKSTGNGNKTTHPASGNTPHAGNNKPAGCNKTNKPTGDNKPQKGGRRTYKNKKH